MTTLKIITLIINLLPMLIASSIQPRSSQSHSANVFRFNPIVLVEEPPIGTLVLDLAAQLDITDLASSDYKFRFYSPHSLTSHYFLIDQLTGHVKTQRMLDREYLCENKVCGPCTANNNCSLPVEIVATQSANKQQKFVSFDVIIHDKNEFAPKFPRDIIYLNLSEAAPPNFVIPIDAAYDRDSKQTHIAYSIEPMITANQRDDENTIYSQSGSSEKSQNNEFLNQMARLSSKISLITSNSGSNGQSPLSLVIKEPFDYEEIKEVKFRILASDGNAQDSSKNQKALIGNCLVILKIIDINDNLPVFDNSLYEYRLDENKAISTTRLIRVHATDKDDGSNGLVKYSLVDQILTQNSNNLNQQQHQQHPPVNFKSLFQIDELTGWISLTSNLDYEQMPVYRLVVQAQDSGLANSMPVYTNVIIYLNDINDNAPIINVTAPNAIDDYNNNLTINAKNLIELSELTMPDTFLAQIIVTDIDSELNGKVKLDMIQYKRKTSNAQNNDEDENIEDDYDDSDLNWSESDDFSLVHLFKNIYSLMTKEKLDRENFDFYLINITATDYGQPLPLKTIVNLTIRIKDENDNRPEFLPDDATKSTRIDANTKQIYYEFNVTEIDSSLYIDASVDPMKWIRLGQVKAIDYDVGKNGEIFYGLEPANENFRIDSQQGVFETKRKMLDRELQDRYVFNVIASDGINNATTPLVLNLLDINDNRPIFEQSVYKFQVYENMLNNEKTLAKLNAIDLDTGNNSRVFYRIVDNEQPFLEVNAFNGEITLLKEFDFERVKQIDFEVIAYDNFNKSVSLNSTCRVQIEVIDLNDNRPILVQPKQKEMPLVFDLDSLVRNNLTTVSANKIKVSLTALNASDADSGLNGQLTFKIEKQVRLRQQNQQGSDSSNEISLNMFEIDKSSGQLFANFNLKRNKYIQAKRGLDLVNKEEIISEKVKSINPKLIGNYEVSSKQLAKNELEMEYDSKIEGIYGLIVSITDMGVDALSTRAYVFVALVKNENETINHYPQINLLRLILSETNLNKNDNSDEIIDDVDDDDYDEEYDENNKPIDVRFNRVIEQFRSFKPKKTSANKDLKLLRKNGDAKSYGYDLSSFIKFANDFLSSLSQNKSYKSMLFITIFACILLTIVFISLCMFNNYYRNKRATEKKSYPNGFIHIDESANKTSSLSSRSQGGTNSSNSSTLLTKTNRTHSTIVKHELVSSSSPSSSLTSSELLVDTVDTPKILMLENQDEMDEIEFHRIYSNRTSMSRKANNSIATSFLSSTNEDCKNPNSNYLVKINNKCHTLKVSNHNRGVSDFNSSSTNGEEEKAALLLSSLNSPSATANTNMNQRNLTTPSSSSSSNNVVSSHTDSTSANMSTLNFNHNKSSLSDKKANIINNQLSVQVANNTGKKDNRKCIVASTESLTSINTHSNNSSKIKQSTENTTMSTSSPHESVSSKSSSDSSANLNSFKTFKNTQINSPHQEIKRHLENHTKTNNNNNNNNNNNVIGYRHLDYDKKISVIPKQQHQLKKSLLDQKQLNLPVNELFKRYELRRQAASGSLSSSESLNSLNTAASQQSSNIKQQQQPNNQYISTFMTSPRSNRANIITNTIRNKKNYNNNYQIQNHVNDNQIPDYFFKDEKEHRKFLAMNNMQILNLKRVDIKCENNI